MGGRRGMTNGAVAVIMAGALAALGASPALACGACADKSVAWGLPFVKYWMFFFPVWLLLAFAADFAPDRTDAARIRPNLRMGVRGTLVGGYFLLSATNSMGAGLPAIMAPFFYYWVIAAAWAAFSPSARHAPPSWIRLNRWALAICLLLAVVVDRVENGDPDRIARFLRYPGGGVREVVNRLVAIGEPAVPAVVEHLFTWDGSYDAGYRSRRRMGLQIVSRIAQRDFQPTYEEMVAGSPDPTLDDPDDMAELRMRRWCAERGIDLTAIVMPPATTRPR